jgi:TolB protein
MAPKLLVPLLLLSSLCPRGLCGEKSPEPVRLTKDGSFKQHLQWSPDGKKIAFISNRGGGYDIYMMEVK